MTPSAEAIRIRIHRSGRITFLSSQNQKELLIMEHNELCLISHTHWDREWYMPREKMRFRLVS